MLYIIMIAIIVILINENKKLSDENKYLRSLNNNTNFNNNVQLVSNNTKNNKNDIPVKKVVNEKEIKNNAILITGSILIVLASIIFLTSSWYSISNIMKTITIVFMLIIFLLSSYIADKYLNLKHTSNAFYYIALAYIPVALFSISIFELFGKYLSFYGAGKFVYLSISSLIVSVIYYICNKNKKSCILASLNFIFILLTIVLGLLIVTNSFKIIMIGLLGFSVIFNLIYLKNKYYLSQNYHLNSSNFISICLAILSLYNIYDYLSHTIDISNIMLNSLLLFNIYLSLIKLNNKKDIYNFIYPFLGVQIAHNISSSLNCTFIIEQSLIISSIAIIYIYDLIKNKKINFSTFIESLICLVIIFFRIDSHTAEPYISKELLLFISSIFAFINYYFDNKNKFISACFLSSIINLFVIYFTIKISMPEILVLYLILGISIVTRLLYNSDVNLKKATSNVGNVFICILSPFIGLDIFSLLFMGLYTIVNCYIGITENKVGFRILSYVFINITLHNIYTYTGCNLYELIFPISTLIIMILEKICNCEKTKTIKIFIFLQFIISFISLLACNELYSFMFLIILNGLYLKYINDYSLNSKSKYVIYASLLPFIYNSNILIFNNFNYMYIVSLLLLALYLYLYFKNKDNDYIIAYYLYALLHNFILENNIYIMHVILLFGSLLAYLTKKGKVKTVFKAAIYTQLLALYYITIKDFRLIEMSIFNIGILFVYLLLVTRTILKKYIEDYKFFEYFGGISICIYALMSYGSEIDGIVFVFGLVLLLIISYIHKFGPIFIISLIFIIFNILILTRAFWLSIPWWIYILLIGTVLIAFAIYNEMKEKEGNELKEKINSIKKNLDM